MQYDGDESRFVDWFVKEGNTGTLEKGLRSIESDIDFARVSDLIAARIGTTRRASGAPRSIPGDLGTAAGVSAGQVMMTPSLSPEFEEDAAETGKLDLLDEEARRRGLTGPHQ